MRPSRRLPTGGEEQVSHGRESRENNGQNDDGLLAHGHVMSFQGQMFLVPTAEAVLVGHPLRFKDVHPADDNVSHEPTDVSQGAGDRPADDIHDHDTAPNPDDHTDDYDGSDDDDDRVLQTGEGTWLVLGLPGVSPT